MFKYTLVSDLHLSGTRDPADTSSFEDTVIVAGDTQNGLAGTEFLRELSVNRKVLAVAGNHEHYRNVREGRDIRETNIVFQTEFPITTDLAEGLTHVGLTGWYNVSDPEHWNSYMNDCHYMCGDDYDKGARDVIRQASFEADYLNDILESFFDRKFIITTHMAPCQETLDPAYAGSRGNEYYWSPFMRQVLTAHADKILVWNHGHTHAAIDKVVDGVRVVCNPRGYPGENPDWKPLTVEVDY